MNFIRLKPKSQIATELLTVAQGKDPWMDYYNFKAKLVPPEIVARDMFLLELAKIHPLVMGVLKMEPNTVYNWHTDSTRGCTINMLLSFDDISHCLFTERPEDVQSQTQELHYEPYTYYLFNTQSSHMVINGYSVRYLASLEFADGLDLGFNKLKAELGKHQLLAQG